MQLRPALSFACVLWFATATLTAQEPVTIGTVTVAAGEMRSGVIRVPAGVDEGTEIPITVAHGARPGPTLALVAGTHGSEVAPIIALHRVRRGLDPRTLRGTIILVHVANLPSFLGRTIYYSPVDRKNLNRVYPGKPDGTVSERIAHAITTESGYLGMPVEDMIRRNETGVWRLLRYLGMVDGPVELVDHHVWFRRTEVLRSPATGVWHPAVERGQFVAATA